MLLKRQEAESFYELYFKVLKSYFRYSKSGSNEIREFSDLSLEEITSLRDKLFDNINYLNIYCDSNPDNCNSEELEIIKGWKYFVKKTFVVYKDLKKYTVFVDTQESLSYGVYGLMTEIRDLLENKFPIMADALLLSYKNCIVFDGLLSPYEMKLSGALNKILINSYQDSKSKNGIITKLPLAGKGEPKTDLELLVYYLSQNRDGKSYAEEIAKLLQNNFKLLKQYYDGIIKPGSEVYSMFFQALGLKKGWYAALDGVIITRGHSEDEVLQKIVEFLPPEKVESVSVFEITGD